MEIVIIPSIVIICYVVKEILKIIFKNNKNKNQLIFTIVGIFGGILGLLAYFIDPSIMLNINSPFTAVAIGMASGISTVSNQIIKGITKKRKTDD